MIGQTISHYKIVGELGSGGMGEVFLAEDTSLHRKVALKLLPPNVQRDELARKRLLREAKSAALLEHANICTIHEVGEFAGHDFIVMEYVDGQTLQDRLAQGPLPWKDALRIAVEIAEALEEAHEKGVVHRDLKPANIMLTRQGHAKVMDFGLAKQVIPQGSSENFEETISLITMQGLPIGTLAYMSPEQLRGETVDCRSDVFSLGEMFYEMMAGRHPFRAANFPSTIDRTLHEEVVPPGSLNPEIPKAIERLIGSMLAKDPEMRPRNAGEVLRKLQAEREPKINIRLGWIRMTRLIKRRRKLLFVVLLVLLFVLAGINPSIRQSVKNRFNVTEVVSGLNLAILPFEPVNVAPENTHLGRVLAETLNARFTRITRRRAIQVVPASEIRAKSIRTPEDAHREFGVNYVLCGTIQQEGDSLRVVYSLIDVHAHRQKLGDTITAPAHNLFALEDQVGESLMSNLNLEQLPQEKRADQDARGTQKPTAYDFYVRALVYLQDYQKPENIENAINVFRNALKIDPKYALAYAGLGEAYWHRYEQTLDAKWVGEALTACEQAVALDDNRARGHICLGIAYNGRGKYEDAANEFARAVALDPTSDDAHRGLAAAHERLGNYGEALKAYRRAIELRPHYWAGYSWLGAFYARNGQYDAAAEMFGNVIRLAPDNYVGYSNLGGIHAYQGRYAEAIRMFQHSVSLKPTGDAYSNLGTACFYQRKFRESASAFEQAARLDARNWQLWGNLADAYWLIPEKHSLAGLTYDKALSFGEQTLQINPRDARLLGYIAYYHAMRNNGARAQSYGRRALAVAPDDPELLFNLTLVYCKLGDTDQSFGWLRKALAADFSKTIIRDTPLLDSLRSNPEFQRLLNKNQFSEPGGKHVNH